MIPNKVSVCECPCIPGRRAGLPILAPRAFLEIISVKFQGTARDSMTPFAIPIIYIYIYPWGLSQHPMLRNFRVAALVLTASLGRVP